MTAIDNSIANGNFLSPLNFKFQLKRAPHINFFIQTVNIPGLSLQAIDVNNPLIRVPYAGDHLMYDELDISFRVDEDLQNYMEMHEWIRAHGKRSFEEFATLKNQPKYSGEGLYSDIILTILKSNKNPNYSIVFQDAFPISLSGIDFNTTLEDVNYLEASAKFRYTAYDITKVT
jgi:hypothetical protein